MYRINKHISVFLAAVMVISMFSVSVCADDTKQAGSKYPTIYVPGRNEDVLVDDVTKENPVNIKSNVNINTGEFAKELAPKIAEATVTGDWSDYCNTLNGLISPMFKDVVLDKNGNPKDNSGVVFDTGTKNLRKLVLSDYTYKIDTYKFIYDYRIDPYENAEKLNAYAKSVMQVTGAEKINLVGRCEGSNIVLAYMEKYATPSLIQSCLFLWPSVTGLYGLTSFFTGNISLDMNAVELNFSSDDSKSELVSDIITILNITNSLDPAADAFNKIYGKVEKQLMPELILNTFGTMPAFWAMVEPEYYQQAKNYVFSGREEEYAGLISKIDYYYVHAASRVKQILKQYTDAGTIFSCVAKYGFDASPLCTLYRNNQTDGMAVVKEGSLGATAANFGSTLSEQYINNAKAAGKYNYISPDRIVDASSCWYPDSTWFVKNAPHSKMPAKLEDFCARLIAAQTQPCVTDSTRYPQYLVYDSRTGDIIQLNENTNIDKADEVDNSFWGRVKAFFQKIADWFKQLFK